jgi:tight adherence protein B
VRVAGVPGAARISYRAPAALRPARRSGVRHTPFWGSMLSVLVVGLAIAVLIGLAVAVLTASYAGAGELRARVRAFVPAPDAPVLPLAGEQRRPSAWARLLSRRRWWSGFAEQVSIGHWPRSAEQLVALAIAASLVVAVLVDLITGSVLVSVLSLVCGPLILRALVRRRMRRQRLRFAEQLPGQLHEIASAMRTGRSFVEGFELAVEHADDPFRAELAPAIAEERAGRHLDEALAPVAARMQSAELEQVAAIGALHRRTGSTITEVLDRIADTARQRVEIRRELLTMTAQARLSRNILSALPLVVVLAIDIIGHRYERPLFHTTGGIAVLIVGAIMVALGALIMKSIVNIQE